MGRPKKPPQQPWCSSKTGRSARIVLVVVASLLAGDSVRSQSPAVWFDQPEATTALAAPSATVQNRTTFRAYALRELDAETAQRQLTQFFASTAGVEVVADSPRNRVLLRGNEQIHQLAGQLLTKLDQPLANGPTPGRPTDSKPAPPTQQLEAYPLSDVTRHVLQKLRREWQSNPAVAGDVRVAMDERTGQALVLAPQAAHQQIRQQLAKRTLGNARVATATGDALAFRVIAEAEKRAALTASET